MRRLDDVLQHGDTSVTLVEGEAGMGKTRLLAELRRRSNELQVLSLSAYALEHVREPYAPFALAVARALETAPPALAADLEAIAAALDPDIAQHKVKRLRAVAAALRGVMRERAVAIFFEDVHWADRASLDLLGFFVAELAATPLFVVVTQRPTGTPVAFADALRTGAHTVRLGPLADRDVATLLREALRGHGNLGADRLRRITGLASGNPLFALELLRNAVAGAVDDIAPAIAYPIVRRWESLDREAREILAVAAAAGEIEPSFLAQVVGSFFLLSEASAGQQAIGWAAMLAACCAVGILNWLLVEPLKLHPMVATLATFMGVQAVSLSLRPTPDGTIDANLLELLGAKIGFVPLSFLCAVSLGALLEYLLYRHRLGFVIRGLGSRAEAARVAGVAPARVRLLAYVGCSLLAFVAAITMGAQVGIGDPRAGLGYTLTSIASVVIGGGSLFGGRGSFIGALLGVIFITQVNTVTNFLGLDEAWQSYLLGGMIVVAVALFSKSRQLAVAT